MHVIENEAHYSDVYLVVSVEENLVQKVSRFSPSTYSVHFALNLLNVRFFLQRITPKSLHLQTIFAAVSEIALICHVWKTSNSYRYSYFAYRKRSPVF